MSPDAASTALTEFKYTLFLIGTPGPDGPHFMIANWGTQTSFKPRRFAALVKSGSRTRANIDRAKAFTVNLVAKSAADIVSEVMKRRGSGMTALPGETAAPRLQGSYAGVDCRLVDVIEVGGDHLLVIGEVVGGWSEGKGHALTLPELNLNYAG